MTEPYDIYDYLMIEPDWKGSLKYRRTWLSSIQRSLDGHQKRSALFTWPRRSLEFRIVATDFSMTAYIKRKLYKGLSQLWGIPCWQDETKLTSGFTAGQFTMNVGSTENRNFEIGGVMALVASPTSYEVGLINDLTATEITLLDPLAATWPSGTKAFPVLVSRIKELPVLGMKTAHLGEILLTAYEDYTFGITRHIGAASEFDSYSGYPVFDGELDWGEIQQGVYHPYDYVTHLGKSAVMDHLDESAFRFSMEYLSLDRSEIWKSLDFFDSTKGRWGSFWLPTCSSDIIVTQPFGAGDTTLTIEPIDYAVYWDVGEMGARIRILWPDGTSVYRRIVSAPSPTTIVLDSAPGKSATEKNLRTLLVSFLMLARFDQDEAEVEYLTHDKAMIKFSFETIIEGS